MFSVLWPHQNLNLWAAISQMLSATSWDAAKSHHLCLKTHSPCIRVRWADHLCLLRNQHIFNLLYISLINLFSYIILCFSFLFNNQNSPHSSLQINGMSWYVQQCPHIIITIDFCLGNDCQVWGCRVTHSNSGLLIKGNSLHINTFCERITHKKLVL